MSRASITVPGTVTVIEPLATSGVPAGTPVFDGPGQAVAGGGGGGGGDGVGACVGGGVGTGVGADADLVVVRVGAGVAGGLEVVAGEAVAVGASRAPNPPEPEGDLAPGVTEAKTSTPAKTTKTTDFWPLVRTNQPRTGNVGAACALITAPATESASRSYSRSRRKSVDKET